MITVSVEMDAAATQRDIGQWPVQLATGVANAMPAVAEAVREHVDSCFASESDPWGKPWSPLAPATVVDRVRHNRAGKILQRDGLLRMSVAGWPIAPEPNGTTATVTAGGPAAPYAAAHQFGTEHIPARPFLPIVGTESGYQVQLPTELEEEIVEMIQLSINRAFEGKGK